MIVRFKLFAVTSLLITAGAVFMFVPAGATLQGLQTGMEAPDFSLRAISGETRRFADLRGDKLTVVLFWSTWSKKSETLLSRMQKLHDKYHDKGFSVIAVNADDQFLSQQTMAEITRMTQRLKLSYPILLDHGLVAFHAYGIIALPSTLVLDRERIIRYELSGYPLEGAEEMAEFIATALEGKKQANTPVKGEHQPNKEALRLFNMGKTTMLSKRMADTAEMWFKKAVEADPDFVLPYLSLGKMYLQRGENGKALGMFERALSKDQANVAALCETGLALTYEGKPDKGQVLLEKALKASDAYTPCYYYAGYVYGKKGDLEKALQMFDEAARMNPSDFSIYLFKAAMFEQNNRQQEAVAAYKRALEIMLNLK